MLAKVQEAGEKEKRARRGQSRTWRAVWLEPLDQQLIAVVQPWCRFRGGRGREAVGVVVLNIRQWRRICGAPAVQTAMYIVY